MLSTKAPLACSRLGVLAVPKRAGRPVGVRAEPDGAKVPEPATPSEPASAEPEPVEAVAVIESEPVEEVAAETSKADEVNSSSA